MPSKILLVEDDKSLREIYGVRLMAEGYQIVAASDGEQALAVAIKERPALIITDVMMPKISGFDMLDILRSTTETKDIKVIMMTALSSDDQRQRGERMGADRYLVKSQVGIEDVVRTVHEVLGDKGGAAPAPAVATVAAAPTPAPAAPTAPAVPAVPAASTGDVAQPQPSVTPTLAPPPVVPQVPPAPMATSNDNSMHSLTTPAAPSARQRIIHPINDINAKVDINQLLDKELAKEAGVDMTNRPQVATTDQEKAIVQDQINTVAEAPVPPTPPAPEPRPAMPPSVPPRPSTPLQAPPRPPVVQ